MCYLQCCNKVAGKPSPVTAGSRATLHSFFLALEKTQPTKPALALSEVTHKPDQEKEETGEAITILLPDEDKEGKDRSDPEESKVGAMATSTKNLVAISRNTDKTERHRRKADRALWRARKARRQLCLPPNAASDKEGEGPAGGGDIEVDHKDIQHAYAPDK